MAAISSLDLKHFQVKLSSDISSKTTILYQGFAVGKVTQLQEKNSKARVYPLLILDCPSNTFNVKEEELIAVIEKIEKLKKCMTTLQTCDDPSTIKGRIFEMLHLFEVEASDFLNNESAQQIFKLMDTMLKNQNPVVTQIIYAHLEKCSTPRSIAPMQDLLLRINQWIDQKICNDRELEEDYFQLFDGEERHINCLALQKVIIEGLDLAKPDNLIAQFSFLLVEDFEVMTADMIVEKIFESILQRAHDLRKRAIEAAIKTVRSAADHPVVTYMKTISAEELAHAPSEEHLHLTVAFLGVEKAGCTRLTDRLSENTYIEDPYVATRVYMIHRIEFHTKTTDSTRHALIQTYDANSGNGLIRFYHFKHAIVLFLAYDLSGNKDKVQKSILELKNDCEIFFKNDRLLVLVGTKIDDDSVLSNNIIDFENFANEQDMPYCCTSSKLGLGFERLRRIIVEHGCKFEQNENPDVSSLPPKRKKENLLSKFKRRVGL